MIKAIYPGSFDPITQGHLDIIDRASKSFDKLYIAIMLNPTKKYSFTPEERKELIEKCVKKYKNVEVVIDGGLTVELAAKLGCKVIVRGIRAVTDYEAELALATSNMMLKPEIETYFLVARPELSFYSSSIAKQVAMFGGDITKFIPKEIQKDVKKKLLNNK